MQLRTTIGRLPLAPGVYRFRDGGGRTLYLGRATELRRRVASYWGDLGDRRHLARMVPKVARVEAVACDSGHEAAWLERNLLGRRLPPWNRIVGGAEVPLYIRLDRGAKTPGVAAAYEVRPAPDTVHFGPYLGGTRVRLAVAALDRVLPLGYAVAGLAGAARELAASRGVVPADRAALAEAIEAVLRRDPSAVASARSALVERRDVAAGDLRYEMAGRIQDEMAALDWVLAEQKVTRVDPDDLDVYGWAGGILVGFEIRAGVLDWWHQRACTEAAARARVAATPPEWAEFARRNAELAAELASAAS